MKAHSGREQLGATSVWGATGPAEITGVQAAPAWHERARCAGWPPELWHDDISDLPGTRAHAAQALAQRNEQARAVCVACPVRRECLTDALTRREPATVRGGYTADERETLRNARKNSRRPRCSDHCAEHIHPGIGHSEHLAAMGLSEDRAEPPATVPKPRRTHCRRGHALTPENSYGSPDGHRDCRTCKRITYAERRAKSAAS